MRERGKELLVFLERLGRRRNNRAHSVRAWFGEQHIKQGVLDGKMDTPPGRQGNEKRSVKK